MRDPEELAWAAGLFAGEGNVGVSVSKNSSGRYPYLKIQMGMYDERAVKRFCEAVGCSSSSFWLRSRGHMFYRAQAVGRSAERVLAMLWPYLRGTDKGDQVLLQAGRLDLVDWITGAQVGVRPQLREKRRGRLPRD